MNPFESLRSYEELLYTLRQRYTSVLRSTLILIRRGKRVAIVQGEIAFSKGYRITVRERLSNDSGQLVIESYGYELWRGEEKIAWYDSQPHPNDSTLVPTFPHHKHVPPDMRNHRVPAPHLHFDHPNIPFLIQEVEDVLRKEQLYRVTHRQGSAIHVLLHAVASFQ